MQVIMQETEREMFVEIKIDNKWQRKNTLRTQQQETTFKHQSTHIAKVFDIINMKSFSLLLQYLLYPQL